MFLIRLIVSAVLAMSWMVGPVQADATKVPTGPVILTVTGLDEAEFPGGVMAFDVPMLKAMGETEVTTTSIWTEGEHVYTGVLLRDLIEKLKIPSPMLRMHALNDYAIEFPAEEATDEAPILAYLFDGEEMSVRDKGPVWVIYPYDDAAKYRSDITFARSIWQLDRIDVLR